ncbi:hypothetical protein L210DRAFT_3560266 [Boletus edulis BED1]|uniref:Uncharacterized protein n=1 Tax=Boletus edulis BED1 TaxID=1328754 RepID=A0AAD4BHV5_BOLED|nr:hypothetical protein L210DRAFT_3560266 [Boletus edulis BED1]
MSTYVHIENRRLHTPWQDFFVKMGPSDLQGPFSLEPRTRLARTPCTSHCNRPTCRGLMDAREIRPAYVPETFPPSPSPAATLRRSSHSQGGCQLTTDRVRGYEAHESASETTCAAGCTGTRRPCLDLFLHVNLGPRGDQMWRQRSA